MLNFRTNFNGSFCQTAVTCWAVYQQEIKLTKMKAKDFDKLLQTVEFELTQRQRFLLFEHLYTTYSFDDMVKFEKSMLNQIKSSVEALNEDVAIEVTKSCDTILKAYKHWGK